MVVKTLRKIYNRLIREGSAATHEMPNPFNQFDKVLGCAFCRSIYHNNFCDCPHNKQSGNSEVTFSPKK